MNAHRHGELKALLANSSAALFTMMMTTDRSSPCPWLRPTPAAMVAFALVALPALLVPACARSASPERASDLRDAAPLGVGHDSASATDAGPSASAAVDAGGDAASTDADGAALAGYPAIVELLDGTEKLGFVAVPLGTHEPRPLLVAIHGGSEKPERACAAWRGVTEAYPFVVCPRGFGGRESALGWRTTADTSARIARAVAATKALFGTWVKDTSSIVLAGFSMGGSQVALLAREAPQTYRRVAVGDSAHDPRPALTFARAWVKGGGERALFLCTTSGCEPSFRAAARNVAKENAPARLNVAPTQVHGLSKAAVQSMRRDWPWLVEGAEGWSSYVAPADASSAGKTETFAPN